MKMKKMMKLVKFINYVILPIKILLTKRNKEIKFGIINNIKIICYG